MKTIFHTAAILLSLLTGGTALAATDSAAENNAGDMTRRYTEFSAKNGAEPPAELKNYRILFVPGFLSNIYDFSRAGISRQLYFSAQIADLRRKGLDAVLVGTNGAGLPPANAKIIMEAVSASTAPVIIIAHSKGGIDSLEALLSYKEMRKKVRGLVTIQTPFFGSEIADAILERKTLSEKAGVLLKKLGGDRETLSSLGTKNRKEYYTSRRNKIEELTAGTPVLSFATRLNKTTPLRPLGDYLAGKGLESDGLVPVRSTLLPGTKHILIDGCDHAMTVFRVPYGDFDKTAMVLALLKIELELIDAKKRRF